MKTGAGSFRLTTSFVTSIQMPTQALESLSPFPEQVQQTLQPRQFPYPFPEPVAVLDLPVTVASLRLDSRNSILRLTDLVLVRTQKLVQ